MPAPEPPAQPPRPGRNPFAETLYCDVRVSPRLCACNRWVHAAALAVVLALALYRPFLLLFVPVIACSYRHLRRGLQLKRNASVRRFRWGGDDTWTWRLHDGSARQGRLIDATVLGPYLVMLRLRATGRNPGATSVLLAADSLSADTHRHLRARLTLWTPPTRTHDAADLLNNHLATLRALVSKQR